MMEQNVIWSPVSTLFFAGEGDLGDLTICGYGISIWERIACVISEWQEMTRLDAIYTVC